MISTQVTVDVVERTYEQRYTNFSQALLTGVVCFRPLIGVLGAESLAPKKRRMFIQLPSQER